MSLVEDVDLLAATPGDDINWLEDVALLEEDGMPAVFDRYSNSFLKIYFAIPEGREDEIARKVLVTHLQSGNSYGIQLKEIHTKFPQPELGPWVAGSKTVGADWKPPVLEGWEPARRALRRSGAAQGFEPEVEPRSPPRDDAAGPLRRLIDDVSHRTVDCSGNRSILG